jgi:glutathione S-transferase
LVAKARLFLRFKGVEFEEQPARLFRGATLANLVEALEAPTLIDGDVAVRGASQIAEYLDQNHGAPVLYPGTPAGARVRLVEQWVDRVLAPSALALRWLVRTNLGRSWESLIAGYAHLSAVDLWSPALRPAFREAVSLRVEGAPSFFGRDAERLNRFARACDHLDGVLAESGWVAGAMPTAADLAAFAALEGLDGMDGWETLRARKRLVAWLNAMGKLLGDAREGSSDVVSVAEAQAFVDARRLAQGPRNV